MNKSAPEPHESGYRLYRRKKTPKNKGYCSACDKYKPVSEFFASKKRACGIHFICKPCSYLNNRTSRKKRPRPFMDRHTLKKFNITEEKYREMLDAQGSVYAICGQPETKVQHGNIRQLTIDHDHDTGEIRGLLCASCNLALGNFKDSPENLSNAIDYLMETHR